MRFVGHNILYYIHNKKYYISDHSSTKLYQFTQNKVRWQFLEFNFCAFGNKLGFQAMPYGRVQWRATYW